MKEAAEWPEYIAFCEEVKAMPAENRKNLKKKLRDAFRAADSPPHRYAEPHLKLVKNARAKEDPHDVRR